MKQEIRKLKQQQDQKQLAKLGFDFEQLEQRQQWICGMYRSCQMNGEFDYIDCFIKPGQAAIDLGANLGHYTLKLAANCTSVLAIEPSVDFAWLSDSLPQNCVFANCAVGESPAIATLNIPLLDGKPQNGMASFTDLTEYGYDQFNTEEVEIRTLDDIVDQHLPNQEIGFMKIDVEGWELQALRGAERTLREHRPNLQVEIWDGDMPATAEEIETYGYRGLFYFDGILHDIHTFAPATHVAPENHWYPGRKDFRPDLLVNNFFFVPVNR